MMRLRARNDSTMGEALFRAVQANQLAAAEALLKTEASFTLRTRDTEDGLLHVAVKNNNPAMIKLLLKNDVDPSDLNKEGQTPIEMAASLNYWSCVSEFARTKKNSANDAYRYGVALLYAAKANQAKIVDDLLAAKAATNCYDDAGDRALHHAVRHHNIPMMRSLIQHGADQTVKNNDKQTPIALASFIAAKDPKHWNVVIAFTEPNEEQKESKSEEWTQFPNLINAVEKISKDPIDSELLKLFNKNQAKNKDKLLAQILEIENPELRQRALWQALDPDTTIGQFFYLKRYASQPSVKSGRLRTIVDELRIILKSDVLSIDVRTWAALNRNKLVQSLFPLLRDRVIGSSALPSASAPELPPSYEEVSGTARVMGSLGITTASTIDPQSHSEHAVTSLPQVAVTTAVATSVPDEKAEAVKSTVSKPSFL